MSYRRAKSQSIVREIGRGFQEVNKGVRSFRRWMFPRKRKVYRRIPPPNMYPTSRVQGVTVEKKSVESDTSTMTTVDVDNVISTTLINEIAEGTAINQRVGRKVQLGTFSIKYTLNSPGDYSSSTVRLIVVFDKQPNGTQMTAADIFQQSLYPATSFLNLGNRQRFVVLKDKKFSVNPVDSSHIYSHTGSFGLNLKKFDTTYNNTGGTIGNIGTGALYMIVCGSSPHAGLPATKPTFSYIWRLRYYDA